MASYRYRAEMPAGWLNATVNDLSASTLIFSKPHPRELLWMAKARKAGKRVIVDFCDNHFEWQHYQEALRLAHIVTCPTGRLADCIEALCGYRPFVIPESWEFPEAAPHCSGNRVLWFGHAVNQAGLFRVAPDLEGFDLHVVGNFEGAIPWSLPTMAVEFAWADAVILPSTADYKSANRAVEAIRQGCFVIAEDHPALRDIPGIWIGNIKEGLRWMQQNRQSVRSRIFLSQSLVMEKFSPKIVTAMWKKVIRLPITSDAETSTGKDGSMLMSPVSVT
jgi:hypothetical protein